MSTKIILQFKSFEICEQKICTKMSNLNNGTPALDPWGFGRFLYTQRGREAEVLPWPSTGNLRSHHCCRPEEPGERGPGTSPPFLARALTQAGLH